MSEFDEIRPYNDAEVPEVLASLVNDNEFLDAIAALKLPSVLKPGSFLFRSIVKRRLKKEAVGVDTVLAFQDKIKSYLEKLIATTTKGWTVSGLERLDKNKSYLFISNHRDIAMDSAFVNWVLHRNGFSTLRIAIGDNLLTKPFASHLMRLNKSFIVNRSAAAPREKLKAAKLLSRYIRYSLLEDGENVWIAQREGRAKDGIDKTNSAIIGMFGLSREKPASFAEHIDSLNIVPVAISYEYDPCDRDKARELYKKSQHGEYVKEEHEDVQSIAKGIVGHKGRVHISFGEPLGDRFDSADLATAEVDRQIKEDYVLHFTNCFAYEILEGKSPIVPVGAEGKTFTDLDVHEEREKFKLHVADCPQKHRDILLKTYANPVFAKLGELT